MVVAYKEIHMHGTCASNIALEKETLDKSTLDHSALVSSHSRFPPGRVIDFFRSTSYFIAGNVSRFLLVEIRNSEE
ncbi:hypothetical protein ACSBR2_037114 [Camellia fascicularis]